MKSIFSERGNLIMAIAVSMLCIVGSGSIAMLAHHDSNDFVHQLQAVEELHLVRSEISRGSLALKNSDYGIDVVILPQRPIDIDHGVAHVVYALKTKVMKDYYVNTLNMRSPRKTVATMARAFVGVRSDIGFSSNNNRSPVEKFGRKYMKKDTFAGFMYLTNTDQSVNGGIVSFWGRDEIWGRVHSNTDIYIQNGGGGNNNGWPLFHDFVSTAGVFRSISGPIPYEQVFPAGYKENAGHIEFEPTADLLRANAQTPFADNDNVDIVYVQLLGAQGFMAWTGDIVERPTPEPYVLYNSYPPWGGIGDSLGINMITFRDTLWTAFGTGQVDDDGVFVESADLWIKGVCGGSQTWGCEGNIYLVDDITYQNTLVGHCPDGYNIDTQEYTDPVNTSDFLGLVSEKSILIRYGWVDPVDPLHARAHPNCSDIKIYAALCALGDGHGETHLDGVFSFEYQHPHPASPIVVLPDLGLQYPDLHLCKYPPLDPPWWPYPANTGNYFHYAGPNGIPDYPWYNPIWPEYMPYMERGKIWIFGSVAQRRRGFVHRSPLDPDDQGHWNLSDWYYGPQANGVNAPGTSGNGVGYDKRYFYDRRFMETPPPFFPEVHVRGGETPYQNIGLALSKPPRNF